MGSLPSKIRKGKSRVSSIGAIRSSGYSTVVIRSFETKLPAKFFAVSASPFSIPSPNIAPPSTIHLTQHNVHTTEDQHYICHILPQAHIFKYRQIDQRRGSHAITVGIAGAIADQVETELAFRCFDASVSLANLGS